MSALIERIAGGRPVVALRGSVARRGPNPLAGMLRDLDQRSRTTRRTSAAQGRRLRAEIAEVEQTPGPPGDAGRPGDPGSPGDEGPPGPPGASPLAAVAVTGSDGRASWTFPQPFDVPPVVVATPVDPNPADNTTVVATLEQVNVTVVTVRVWRSQALLGLGLFPLVPAGAGVQVHLLATPNG